MKFNFDFNINHFNQIVFFTGAGMSAESGVPTYRGRGGIWHKYNFEDYACQSAFKKTPEKVLKFHEVRRQSVLSCRPHEGHYAINKIQKLRQKVHIITQNIDGMHQRSGANNVIELHGSLWRLWCPNHGLKEDLISNYTSYKCEYCDCWLRPDIIWFGDSLKADVIEKAVDLISNCDLFVGVGTSGVVWPAAGFPEIAKNNGAVCLEVNTEKTEMSHIYDDFLQGSAGKILPNLLKIFDNSSV